MNVECLRDPIVRGAVEFVENGGRALLIAAAPGMGKSSILASVAVSLSATSPGRTASWISGEVVAGEAHLARLLDAASSTNSVGCVLAVDDADEMLSKRERVAVALESVLAGYGAHLIGTAHPASVNRLVAAGPFHGAEVLLVGALDAEAARALVLRRAPSIPARLVDPIIQWAGGHPAALVYLSRLGEVSRMPDLDAFLDWAAEFAGTVYAEPWTGLGPQQRAILRQLAAAGTGEDSVSSVATSLALPSAQVGAQLGRLVMAGLAYPTGVRGRYAVTPLLARWIARRATRDLLRGRR